MGCQCLGLLGGRTDFLPLVPFYHYPILYLVLKMLHLFQVMVSLIRVSSLRSLSKIFLNVERVAPFVPM